MSQNRDLPDYEETRRALEVFLGATEPVMRTVSEDISRQWFEALGATAIQDVAAYLHEVHTVYEVLPSEHADELAKAAGEAGVGPELMARIRASLQAGVAAQPTPVGKDLTLLWNVEAGPTADEGVRRAALVLLMALLSGGLVGATAHLPPNDQVRAYLFLILPILVGELRRKD